MSFIYLTFGAAIGTLLRFFISLGVNRFMGFRFPFGTLFVNLLGCFFAGCVYALVLQGNILSQNQIYFLSSGVLSAFTTFSTFILEMENQIDFDTKKHAFINLIISVLGGILLFILGKRLFL